jgi:uncharacterized damage-inducible protein DinB
MTNSDFFDESLDAWRYERQGLIREVENIPADKFDFRPTVEVRTVGELVQHILEGSMMMVGELTRDEPNFRRMPYLQLMEEHAAAVKHTKKKDELIALLESQVDDGITRFKEVGADAMMGPVINFGGSTWSRMQWFFHAMNEEHYHRGQLATYERLLGLVPALTQQIMGSAE